jgi:hypothetical protein
VSVNYDVPKDNNIPYSYFMPPHSTVDAGHLAPLAQVRPPQAYAHAPRNCETIYATLSMHTQPRQKQPLSYISKLTRSWPNSTPPGSFRVRTTPWVPKSAECWTIIESTPG